MDVVSGGSGVPCSLFALSFSTLLGVSVVSKLALNFDDAALAANINASSSADIAPKDDGAKGGFLLSPLLAVVAAGVLVSPLVVVGVVVAMKLVVVGVDVDISPLEVVVGVPRPASTAISGVYVLYVSGDAALDAGDSFPLEFIDDNADVIL